MHACAHTHTTQFGQNNTYLYYVPCTLILSIIFKNYNQDPYLDPKLNSRKTLTMWMKQE